MDYRGVVIEESLADKTILSRLKIVSTEVEPVTPEYETPWLTQWTLDTIDVPEENADATAHELSESLDKAHDWYADYKNESYHYIIYREKVFKVDLRNPILYKDARAYGISLGIPEYQVDFAPNDKVWER
jgi:hypothetical protein